MTTRLMLKVGGLHTIDADLPSFRPTHLIGILDPAMPDPSAYAHEPASRDALVMRFRDSESGRRGRSAAGSRRGHAGADRAPRSSPPPAGSSSIAMAASAAAPPRPLPRWCGATVLRRPSSPSRKLLRLTTKPWPNRTIVRHADALLGAGGRMLAALDDYRRAHPQRLAAFIRLHRIRAARDPVYGEMLGVASWPPPQRRLRRPAGPA